MLTRLLLALLCHRIWGKRVDMQQVERNILWVDSTGGGTVESNNSRMSVDMQQVERNILSVDASPPALSAAGCPPDAGVKDPNVLINTYIQEYHARLPSSHINIIVRPVSDQARQLICTGRALGKGMDILPKSSKCKMPQFSKGNEGYVSYCQSCNEKWWQDNPQYDVYGPFVQVDMAIISDDVMSQAFKVWKKLTTEDRQQVVKGRIHGVCQNLAKFVSGGMCFTTCRKAADQQNEVLQKIAAGLIADPEAHKPYRVNERVIRMMEHERSQPTPQKEYVPFFAYKLESGTTLPVVSDYDIFTVGEFPVKGATGVDRYPLMNLVPEIWSHKLLKTLVESTFGEGFSSRKQETPEAGKMLTKTGKRLYGNIVGEKFVLSQAAAIQLLKEEILPRIDSAVAAQAGRQQLRLAAAAGRSAEVAQTITYQAYGDPGSLLVSADLIALSSAAETNAVAHHMETFNYHNVQKLPVDEHHTIFWSNDGNPTAATNATGALPTGVVKTGAGMGTIYGINALVDTYRDLLNSGWCLPFNYGWLRQADGGVGQKMSQLFIDGYKLAQQRGPLEGCPFYDERVTPDIIRQIREFIFGPAAASKQTFADVAVNLARSSSKGLANSRGTAITKK